MNQYTLTASNDGGTLATVECFSIADLARAMRELADVLATASATQRIDFSIVNRHHS